MANEKTEEREELYLADAVEEELASVTETQGTVLCVDKSAGLWYDFQG